MTEDEAWEKAESVVMDYVSISASCFANAVYDKLRLGEPPQGTLWRLEEVMTDALVEVVARRLLTSVPCKFCGMETLPDRSHLHQGKHVCEACWDERLRVTE